MGGYMGRIIKFRGKIEGNWWYVTPDDDSWEQFWALVDRETVGQFIGALDKHKKEIYEDDILQWGMTDNPLARTYKRVVVYSNSRAMFLPNVEGDEEIIGNTHEDTEILEN
jgi:hypothetical protein